MVTKAGSWGKDGSGSRGLLAESFEQVLDDHGNYIGVLRRALEVLFILDNTATAWPDVQNVRSLLPLLMCGILLLIL